MSGRPIAGLLVAVFAVASVAACGALSPTPDPSTRAERLLAGVHIAPTAPSSSLLATNAISDLGVTLGLRFVRVRIVDRLDIAMRVESDEEVVFAEPPRFCLVGPFSAPSDAGLSDRCWGDPDLAGLLLAQMATDASGRYVLRAGQPITVGAELRRGDARCDYPPGGWVVEVKANPVVDGVAMGARYLPDVPFDIPFATPQPLQLVIQSRYCGLATVIVRDQGEPPVKGP